VPLQEVFLSDLTHPYQCCSIFKGGKSSCLACEMDKLFLEHFGSAIGIDAIAALEEEKEAPSTFPIESGHPVIPSNFLAEVWKNSTVRHLARHDQHDAQEFYHALIDGLETDVLSYQETLGDMQQAIKCQSQIKNSAPSPGTPSRSSIKDIFEGELRSVLICDECGCKRSQLETFLNLSLPLKNQFPSQSEVATRERVTTRSETNSIHSCLNHLTDPETLSDPIDCPSCNRKTKTLKQHTFAKLPRVLCLHLKRFDAASNKKISDFVSFPASDLDMGNYLPHWRVYTTQWTAYSCSN
jgi:ubiquitin carboxyl-terminal hydrolase 22/27/51